MKKGFLVFLVLAAPMLVHAHPGKTDAYGGHQCIKDCAEWDLYYREYHLHDKEGRPVRVAQRKQRTVKPALPTAEPPAEPQAEPQAPVPHIVHAVVLPAVPPEPEQPLFPLDWALVVILLLLLLLYRKVRSRRSGEGS